MTSATSGGLTALLDAVHMGLQEMKHAKNPRKALLIISDGGDNNSRFTPPRFRSGAGSGCADLRDGRVRAGLVIWLGLTLGGDAPPNWWPKLLSEIAEQTGGRALAATNLRDLPGIAERIGIELRNQYVLAYSPPIRTTTASIARCR